MPSNSFMFRHKGEKAFDEVSFSFYCFPNGNIMSSSCLMDHDSYTSAFSVVKSLNFLPKIILSAIDKYRNQAWCFNQTGLEKIFQAFTFVWQKFAFTSLKFELCSHGKVHSVPLNRKRTEITQVQFKPTNRNLATVNSDCFSSVKVDVLCSQNSNLWIP